MAVDEDQPAEGHFTESLRVGLQLPNGSILWPPDTYLGHDITTVDDRRKFVDHLRESATQMQFEEADLLGRYKWISQGKYVVTITKEQIHELTDEVPGGTTLSTQ